MSDKITFWAWYGITRYMSILSYENEVLQSVFMNKKSEIENQPLYDRFVTAEGMHAVPPPMTGNYMPSGPDVEVDDSKFTYGPKQTQPSESESQLSDFDTCESNISTEPSELVSEPVVNESNVECQRNVGCSGTMYWNKAYLAEFQDFNGGPVAFGGSRGYITGKGKQHKASCKAKTVSSISHSLQLLHMDLFGPTSVRSLNHKTYCLVITDDFSRFSWVFFLRTKDETSAILKDFIRQIENQLNQKVKTIRSDNGTKFKNKDVIEFCGSKGIKREYSNARTPQQNGVAERKNRTLIEAARTMLADSFLPNTFWAEAVSTACYVLNRVLVTKPYNKTPYELLTGFDKRKSDEGFLVGYSLQSKAFRVYNLETKRVEENLHINFLENKPNVAGKGPTWLFDLDYLTDSMNYHPISSENQANHLAGQQEANQNADEKRDGRREEEQVFMDEFERLKRQEKEANEEAESLRKKFETLVIQEGAARPSTKKNKSKRLPATVYLLVFPISNEPKKISEALGTIESWVDAWQEELNTAEVLTFAHVRLLVQVQLNLEAFLVKDWRKPSEEDVQLIGHSKVSHLSAVKRILVPKGKPKLGLWYPRVSSFDLESYSDSDYAGANLDKKSTTEVVNFLVGELIFLQCKKQTIVATSTTEAEYVAAASCCGQVLWIQNQMFRNYGSTS
ncbi:putative ribonuclease H-like domain-containing protein [Tanacetum coccineum]